jgi:uncharacterized membrane protein
LLPKLSNLLFAIRTNFWFIPIVLSMTAFVVALVLVETDVALQEEGAGWPIDIPVASARLAVSTIAGSMITIASLVISMTLVSLTLVSQQFGPRIIVRFMDDRPTQIVLGLFVATFVFAMIVLMQIGNNKSDGIVPGLSVSATGLLALISLGMMIHFIHHVATRIQADVIINELGLDLLHTAEMLVRPKEHIGYLSKRDEDVLAGQFRASDTWTIDARMSGYLRGIDSGYAGRLAAESGVCIRIDAVPGDFVHKGSRVLTVAPQQDTAQEDMDIEKFRDLISIASQRTPEASVIYEINALNEVALRALSPGINDPHTASACIDRLTDGLRVLMSRENAQRVFRDQDDNIRVIYPPEPFSLYLSKAYGPIWHSGCSIPIVREKLEQALDYLTGIAGSAADKKAIRKFARQLALPREDGQGAHPRPRSDD